MYPVLFLLGITRGAVGKRAEHPAKQIVQDMGYVVLLFFTGVLATIFESARAIFAWPWLLALVS